MYNMENISSFLYYGYLPKWNMDFESNIFPNNDLKEIRKTIQANNECKDESILIDKGIKALKASFTDANGKGKNIVPLSGGLDSRTILAGLIDAGLKDSIITVTFGTPGTWDYELGSSLAQELGLCHETIDLTKIRIEEKHLLETARNSSAWTFLIDGYFNSLICKRYGKDATYWSGFMGDNIAGSHLPASESLNWSKAKCTFLGWNRFVRSTSLFPPGFNPEKSLPPSPLIDGMIISYDDALDFFIRQQNCIKPTLITNGYRYKTPFISFEWVKFILTIPRYYRENNYIYNKIIMKAYPEIISFPAKNAYGGRIGISKTVFRSRHILSTIRNKVAFLNDSKMKLLDVVWDHLKIYQAINYIDFDFAIRNRPGFKSLVFKNINDLKHRKILNWLDLDHIWLNHQNKNANHGKALMLLTALEINLKTSHF
ncbi:MAG: hypothetical protein JEZ12_08310 [Desulfobacterium sp.]|nr:hypothetical protein [Desulfobacterium sp.]